MAGEWERHYHAFSAAMCTISVFHMKSVLNVVSRHFGVAFNIPRHNVGIYASKLISYRFFLGMMGSFTELMINKIVLAIVQAFFTLHDAINRHQDAIQGAVEQDAKEIDKSGTNAQTIAEKIHGQAEQIKGAITSQATSIQNVGKSDSDSPAGKIATAIQGAESTHIKEGQDVINEEANEIASATNKGGVITELAPTIAKKIVQITVITGAIDTKKGDIADPNQMNAENQKAQAINVVIDVLADIIKDKAGEIARPGDAKGVKEKIYNAINKVGDIGKHLRKYKIKQLAPTMAKKIVDQGSGGSGISKDIEDNASGLVGTITNVTNIKQAISDHQTQILEKIVAKAATPATDANIKLHAKKLAEEIMEIEGFAPKIAREISESNISLGIFRATLEYVLMDKASAIAKNVHNVAKTIKDGLTPGSSGQDEKLQKVIAKAWFKLLIEKIIEDKAETIATKTSASVIQISIQTQVTGGIKDQETRKQIMTKYLADDMVDKILQKLSSEDKFIRGLRGVGGIEGDVKDVMKAIIKDKAEDIATQGSDGQIKEEVVNQIKDEIQKDDPGKNYKSRIAGAKAGYLGTQVRMAISVSTFVVMGIARAIFLRKLYSSTNLGYHAYLILNVEGLSWGFVQMTLFPLTPMHSAVTTMSIDVSTMTIFFFQLALDAFLFHRPLYMIKIEMWIIVFWNLVAIPIWVCSIYDIVSKEMAFYNYQGRKGMDSVWSPYWMFFFVSLLKDYMFPGVMPYALLTPDQAHLTNIVFPPFYIMGSILVILLDEYDKGEYGFGRGNLSKQSKTNPGGVNAIGFKQWGKGYHAFWLLYPPQVLNYYYAHVAIHTTGKVSKFILGNRGFVLFMAIVMQLGYSILESLSFVCVANFTFAGINFAKRNGTKVYLETHNLMAEVYRFIFSKASVGYNNLRNRYGLGMNVVHPHRLRPPGAWYWIGQSCVIAYKDTMNDLRMNIGDYL